MTRMPGSACLFHEQGRCLYDEHLNPGYHRAYRCVVLEGWEEAFDAFLDRAEAFGLDARTAGEIWESRLARLAESGQGCPRLVPGRPGGQPGCVLALGDLCSLALPACEGICPRFRLKPGPDSTTEK